MNLSLVLNLLQRHFSIFCRFNLAKKYLQIQFAWPYKHRVNGTALRMDIIHVTKGNRGVSQGERCDMIGDSIKYNDQGGANLACDFTPLVLFSFLSVSHIWLSILEHLSSEPVQASTF